MKKLGVIVNPIAGMGGRVGLKGSDGVETLRKARELGAKPESPHRAVQALKVLARIEERIQIITCPNEMGESACRESGFSPAVLRSIRSSDTSGEDTREAARQMVTQGVDLLLFAGGDGTARDIYNVVGAKVPALGIPAGVKIHSAVYAVTPRCAGEAATMFLTNRLMNIREAEVMDIDEDAFRAGVVAARLYGYLRVPEENRFVQSVKSGGGGSETATLRGIAAEVIQMMDDTECYFVIGPGTTTRAVMEALSLKNTLLGVDIVRNRRLVATDVTETELLGFIEGNHAKLVITAIGGQGHVFGRGNQQISPHVIRLVGRENILLVATKQKLASLCGRPLLVDTGDEELNDELSSYMKIITGFEDYVIYKLGY